jgi:gliding motility-associated-like protein
MKKSLSLMWMLWLMVDAFSQDTCFQVPTRLINAISNPTFENDVVPCTSGYSLVPGWTSPTNEVPLAFLNACTDFIIPDSTILNEFQIMPNTSLYPFVPQPIPSGNGVAAVSDFGFGGLYYVYPFHKSYLATCSKTILHKDSLYRLNFNVGFGKQRDTVIKSPNGIFLGPQLSLPEEKFSLFGESDCGILNSAAPIIGCPSRVGWILLGTVRVNGAPGTWVNTSIMFTPEQDIQALVLGPSCDTVFAGLDSFVYQGRTFFEINYSYFLNDIQLFVSSVPQPVLSISSGTPCTGSFNLQMQPASFYAGSSIQWFRNDTLISSGQSPTLNVASGYGGYGSGWYFCKVQNDSVCLNTDSVFLHWTPAPAVSLLGAADTTACNGGNVVLKPVADSSSQFLWQDGSTQPYYVVTHSGNYYVKVSNACGSVQVKKTVNYEKCNYNLSVPNAFSPNGDGNNDIFRVLYNYPPAQFSLSIYNRHGMKIFTSSDPSQGWDGTFKGLAQPLDAYVWTIYYSDQTGVSQTLKGTVMLIR